MPEFRIVDAHEGVSAAIAGKATKYGNLDLPFLIALNVLDELADLTDVKNGVLGEECVEVTRHSNGSVSQCPSRNRNGAWYGPRGPQNKTVSAVLAALRLSPWNIRVNTPALIHNPWAHRPFHPDLWRMPQLVPNMADRRLETRAGDSASDVLGLTAPWPMPD
jgi:hypothetical protein